jgi:hypothetical protein
MSKLPQSKSTGTKRSQKNSKDIRPIDPDETDSTFECPACINVPNVVAEDEMEHILAAPTVPKRARFMEYEIIAERKKDHRHNPEYLVDSVPVWRGQHAKDDKLEPHNLQNEMLKKWYLRQRPEHNRTKEVYREEYKTMVVLKGDARVDNAAFVESEGSWDEEDDLAAIRSSDDDFDEVAQEQYTDSEYKEDGKRMKAMLQHILNHAQDEETWTRPLNSKQYAFASRFDELQAQSIDRTIDTANTLVLRDFAQQKSKEETKGKAKKVDYSGINIIYQGRISNRKAEKGDGKAKATTSPDSEPNCFDASVVWNPYLNVKNTTVDHIIGLGQEFRKDLAIQIIENCPHALQYSGQVLPLIITLIPRADIDELLDQLRVPREHEWYERRIMSLIYNMKYVFEDMSYLDVMRIFVDLTSMLHRAPPTSTEGSDDDNGLPRGGGNVRSYQQGKNFGEDYDMMRVQRGAWDDEDHNKVKPPNGQHATKYSTTETTPTTTKTGKASKTAELHRGHRIIITPEHSEIGVKNVDRKPKEPKPSRASKKLEAPQGSIVSNLETTQTHNSDILGLKREPSSGKKRGTEFTSEDRGWKKRRSD